MLVSAAIPSFQNYLCKGTRFPKRNMSTPADHQPSKKPSDAPVVPRPSARYAIVYVTTQAATSESLIT